jgi:hypothetical protein
MTRMSTRKARLMVGTAFAGLLLATLAAGCASTPVATAPTPSDASSAATAATSAPAGQVATTDPKLNDTHVKIDSAPTGPVTHLSGATVTGTVSNLQPGFVILEFDLTGNKYYLDSPEFLDSNGPFTLTSVPIGDGNGPQKVTLVFVAMPIQTATDVVNRARNNEGDIALDTLPDDSAQKALVPVSVMG